MKHTPEQLEQLSSGKGCTVIKTCVTPDAAEDKSLPTNSWLLTLEKDGDTWFDIVMGGSVSIFDNYYDVFGDCMKKMSYTKGQSKPYYFLIFNPSLPKKKKK